MALNKSTAFPSIDQKLAAWAKALAHPARIAILRTLAEKQSCICGEIVDVLPLSQSTVSQHLKALKEADLVSGEVEGVRSCYCVNLESLKELRSALGTFLDGVCQCGEGCGC